MNASDQRIHHFHADASPVGGHLTHPVEGPVHTQASVSLSPAGGHASARLDDIKFDHIFHCKAAHSHATGGVHKTSRNWTTTISSVVEYLNVLDVVTADRIVCNMGVEYPRVGHHPKLTFVGSQFVNLRIAGRPVNPIFNHGLFSTDAAESAARTAKEDGILHPESAPTANEFPDKPWTETNPFVQNAVEHSNQVKHAEGAPAWLKHRFDWIKSPEERAQRGLVLTSIVQKIRDAAHGSSFGHVLHVPGFGNIFLGELAVYHGSFRITMLRIEMGCIADGDLAFAAAGSNGSSWP